MHLNNVQYDEVVMAQNDIIILNFWAPWYALCTQFSSIFETVSDVFSDIAFNKVNVETEEAPAHLFQVRSTPTITFMRDGITLLSRAGTIPADALKEGVANLQELDMTQVRQDLLNAQPNTENQI